MPDAASNPARAPQSQRWGLIAAGLLLIALALVVIYTSRSAFSSPLALVVVAAIGLAALLLQIRLRKDLGPPVHAPLWISVVGLVFATFAIFADVLRFRPSLTLVAALGAVFCFATSGVVVLHTLRKRRP